MSIAPSWNPTTFVLLWQGAELFLHSCEVTFNRVDGCDILHKRTDAAIFAEAPLVNRFLSTFENSGQSDNIDGMESLELKMAIGCPQALGQ